MILIQSRTRYFLDSTCFLNLRSDSKWLLTQPEHFRQKVNLNLKIHVRVATSCLLNPNVFDKANFYLKIHVRIASGFYSNPNVFAMNSTCFQNPRSGSDQLLTQSERFRHEFNLHPKFTHKTNQKPHQSLLSSLCLSTRSAK